MTDNDRLLYRKARHLRLSSLDEATLERVPSLFDEKAIGDRRADQAGGYPTAHIQPRLSTLGGPRRFDELDQVVAELKRKEKVDGRKRRE